MDLLNPMERTKNAGARPPIPKFVRKVNAHTEANATCFFHRGQRRGSFGSVGDGCGKSTVVNVPSFKLARQHQQIVRSVCKNRFSTLLQHHRTIRLIKVSQTLELHFHSCSVEPAVDLLKLLNSDKKLTFKTKTKL
jgi:hypothetical protein